MTISGTAGPRATGVARRAAIALAAVAVALLALSASARGAASTDVMFVFDTTGSMTGALDDARTEVESAMGTVAGQFPDVRFGAAQVRDHGTDPVWEVSQGLTTDRTAVAGAISGYFATGGGDGPEAYGTALRETDRDPAVGWRVGAKRVMVLIGDDVPHDDDLNSGVPAPSISEPSPWDTSQDPGLDGTGVDWQSQLVTAASRGLTLAYVHYNGLESYLPYWSHWTGITGGSAVLGGDGVSLALVLSQIVSKAATSGPVDSDGDGLPDLWEAGPADVTGDPTPDLDLAALGARPDRPDIFVQLDWTSGTALRESALRKVVDAFAARGIALHIDHGPRSLLDYATGERWGDRSQARELSAEEMKSVRDGSLEQREEQIRLKRFSALRQRVEAFRYGISDVNRNGGSTGFARVPAQVFYVSVCADSILTNFEKICDATSTRQAGTLMHELGHTLGLGHGGAWRDGGRLQVDGAGYKPNYLSVMNYHFQLGGTSRGVDYSDAGADRLSVLDERSLVEADGLLALDRSLRGLGSSYYCDGKGTKGRTLTVGGGPVDWNCNGRIDTKRVSTTISIAEQEKDLLTPRSDWGLGFEFRAGQIGAAAYGARLDDGALGPEPPIAELEAALAARAVRPRIRIRGVAVAPRGRGATVTAVLVVGPTGVRGSARLLIRDRTGARSLRVSRPVRVATRRARTLVPVTIRRVRRGATYRLAASLRTDAWSVSAGPRPLRVPR